MRGAVGAQRIIAVLEPRSNTMKLGTMKDALAGQPARSGPHVLLCAANLGWDAGAALAPLGYRADVHDDLDRMVEAIAAFARPGDHVLVMSNGGFGGVHGKILEALAQMTATASRRARACSICTGFAARPRASRRGRLLLRSKGCPWRRVRACTFRRSTSRPPPRWRRPLHGSNRTSTQPRERLTLVGSSLGGFYATHLAERFGARAVLINPAIRPYDDLRSYLGRQTNLYSGETFEVTEAHFDELAALAVERITRPERYWLLVQTGDEVLDYRQSVGFYAGAFQSVEGGGDHAFQRFASWIPAILRFAGIAPAMPAANGYQPTA